MKKIVTLCDMCVDQEQDSPDKVETYVLTVNGTSLSCDLCDPCHETWIGNVWDALSDVGRKPTDQPRKRKVNTEIIDCPHCERIFNSQTGFKNHLKTHDKDWASKANKEAIEVLNKKRLSVVSVDTSGSHKCDQKGCDRAFTTNQGLSLHRFRTHGVKGSERKAS